MASIQLYGKTLEIPRRNEFLVKQLREMLELAEDGRLVSMAYVGRCEDGGWELQIIEDDALNFAALGAISMLHSHYQQALFLANQDDDDHDD